MTPQYDIVALGEALIDFTPAPPFNGAVCFARNPGGAPANLLATAAQYGCQTALITKVGKDMFGSFLIETISNCGIDTAGICVDPTHNTTLAFVALDHTGDRSFSFYRNYGADVFLAPEDLQPSLIQNTRLFHFGSLSLTAEPAISATQKALEIAKNSGAWISYDPNYRALLWPSESLAYSRIKEMIPLVNILKVSMEEAISVCGQNTPDILCKNLLELGPSIVLITDGGNGAWYASRQIIGHFAAPSVRVVDTTGAGDIFFGTFLTYFLQSNETPETISETTLSSAVRIAVTTASQSTEKYGAIPSIPQKLF